MLVGANYAQPGVESLEAFALDVEELSRQRAGLRFRRCCNTVTRCPELGARYQGIVFLLLRHVRWRPRDALKMINYSLRLVLQRTDSTGLRS